jgi:PAS domain S-box-containing protein
MRTHPLPRRIALALLVGLLSCWSAGTARGSDPGRIVLVLHPDANDGRPGNVLVDRAIRAGLANGDQTGSEVRHKESGFWALYRWHILGVVSLCVVQALLIFGLLVQRGSRRQAEHRFQQAVEADVAERKRAELVLRESESRFRRMADTAPVMIWLSGSDRQCTYVNKPWLDFTGRPLEGELGDGWSESVHADDLGRCMDTYTQAFEARREFRMEYRVKRFDGAYRWVLDTGVPRFKPDGTFEGYIGSCVDVTDQKEAMDALRESQKESRALTGRLLQAQETERRRIARELHDDLSQSLAILAVELGMLAHNPPEPAAELAGHFEKLCADVKQLSSTVHNLSHELHPAKLEQLGLVAAVRGLCRDLTQSHGLPIEFAQEDVPATLPRDTALCLYRIAQESLQNVIKHSAAQHAAVKLSGNGDSIRLRVVDDGCGFDAASRDGKEGLGLVGMRERLRLVRGVLTIDSRPAAGTRIEVRVPLPPAKRRRNALRPRQEPVGCAG